MIAEHLERSLIELNFALAELMYDERGEVDREEIAPLVAMMQALRHRISTVCERSAAAGHSARMCGRRYEA